MLVGTPIKFNYLDKRTVSDCSHQLRMMPEKCESLDKKPQMEIDSYLLKSCRAD